MFFASLQPDWNRSSCKMLHCNRQLDIQRFGHLPVETNYLLQNEMEENTKVAMKTIIVSGWRRKNIYLRYVQIFEKFVGKEMQKLLNRFFGSFIQCRIAEFANKFLCNVQWSVNNEHWIENQQTMELVYAHESSQK